MGGTMNTKHSMVSMLLVAIMATQTMVGAEDQFDCINRTEATYRAFQKNIKCVLSKQPCMNEQKKRILKQGAALMAIVLIWASIGMGSAWWIQQCSKKPEKMSDSDPQKIKEHGSSEPSDYFPVCFAWQIDSGKLKQPGTLEEEKNLFEAKGVKERLNDMRQLRWKFQERENSIAEEDKISIESLITRMERPKTTSEQAELYVQTLSYMNALVEVRVPCSGHGLVGFIPTNRDDTT